jgi:hypothetical protein
MDKCGFVCSEHSEVVRTTGMILERIDELKEEQKEYKEFFKKIISIEERNNFLQQNLMQLQIDYKSIESIITKNNNKLDLIYKIGTGVAALIIAIISSGIFNKYLT